MNINDQKETYLKAVQIIKYLTGLSVDQDVVLNNLLANTHKILYKPSKDKKFNPERWAKRSRN